MVSQRAGAAELRVGCCFTPLEDCTTESNRTGGPRFSKNTLRRCLFPVLMITIKGVLEMILNFPRVVFKEMSHKETILLMQILLAGWFLDASLLLPLFVNFYTVSYRRGSGQQKSKNFGKCFVLTSTSELFFKVGREECSHNCLPSVRKNKDRLHLPPSNLVCAQASFVSTTAQANSLIYSIFSLLDGAVVSYYLQYRAQSRVLY